MALAAACLGLAAWGTYKYAGAFYRVQLTQQTDATGRLIQENLRAEIAKFSAVPGLISRNNAFVSLLGTGLEKQTTPAALDAANSELNALSSSIGASELYLMDIQGTTIAASNAGTAKSFIGRNFNFRPYFKDAREGREGRYLAVGTTTDEAGYYLSAPVRSQGTIVGVSVLKIRLEQLDVGFQSANVAVAVSDEYGIVFISTEPTWRFRSLRTLTADELEAMKHSQKYADRKVAPFPFVAHPDSTLPHTTDNPLVSITSSNGTAREYLLVERPLVDMPWRLLVFAPTQGIRHQALVVSGFTASTVMLVGLAYVMALQRQRRTKLRLAEHEHLRLDLERRVAVRTQELSDANLRLKQENAERGRVEAALRAAQADLVQAAKMAALGQMSAGISHELNQPLAASRAYAENARVFIERSQTGQALENLAHIASLTDRMGRIIKHLRTFARDEPVDIRPTSLRAAILASVSLVDARLRAEAVDFKLDFPDDDCIVMAGDVRLQQVFVNMFTNALDSMRDADRHELRVSVNPLEAIVRVRVQDTGTGISPEHAQRIFDPFFTTKAVGEGLGLGLSISLGIVQQFGGSIVLVQETGSGTTFELSLKAAARRAQRP
jgi:two-component system, NtrC family, C4-dicarboxylate transport sensor histidine kinase DctB